MYSGASGESIQRSAPSLSRASVPRSEASSSVRDSVVAGNDPRFASVAARNDNVDELYAFLAEVLRTRSTQEWMADFVPAGIPAMRP